ncbi:3-hydroxyacyl-CoA dehydrogenase NAD-binding domain-containing protein [Defluviimonas sp. D31]|uniref:3-hydroxyacyl-CoA dehydrogenase NAD-binding domain-containing protein n=1 Tax=Defluviimonas sp. D31 TaxID=3083253 RepID=UPI00296F6FF9|nr:3-hydroxyacyl-CoA dehydrogenase NAD-binding domain-containing protein [Defluviimonas sp. D31]MDW4551547.1 3-hydroxyacyl-CoA dehydrogenase NAD-binding domain-containing protein [Defluviimonas sp. D31]
MYPDPTSVIRVTTLGAGPIGGGWAAHFLARGYDVTAYIHAESERAALMSVIDTGWMSLKALGLAPGASRDRLTVTTDLDAALRDAQFIQESAPERLELKQALYKHLGEIAPRDCVIASSTSGLMMTDIQKDCPTPERTVIGHPFNPPYLLPLVEIIGGKRTDPAAVQWAADFYKAAGKVPLIMKKEIPGFVATRLQEALWREALHMVANGEATPEDIDNALMNGPAPRMAVQGQCMAFHVACGEGGMATNLDQFGPALKWPWTRLEAPELTQELRDRMVDGCNAIAAGRHFEDMAAQRDREIVAVLNAIRAARRES